MQLAAVYGSWARVVEARKQIFVRRFLMSFFWILVITILVLALHRWIKHLFEIAGLERRQLQTLRAVVLFVVQAFGFAMVLMIIFGVPTNFATGLGLVGAGVAVGLQDFIVGFFGWFILIGKDGIRTGDWVEINGVGGEVRNWAFSDRASETGTDAGRLTGRKVRSSKLRGAGPLFNFSTSATGSGTKWKLNSGDVEPHEMAEAIQKSPKRNRANARIPRGLKRGAPSRRDSFGKPSASAQRLGASVLYAYRAINERHEVRDRIYRAAVELLRSTKAPEPAPALPTRHEPSSECATSSFIGLNHALRWSGQHIMPSRWGA